MNVRVTQLDGKLPNFALMRLSAFHKARGDVVWFTRSPYRQLDEPDYDVVYGSAVFNFSGAQIDKFRREFPQAIVGGTCTDPEAKLTVESIIGDFAGVDYEPFPDFTASIGFSQRGCRFKCEFCAVPKKEGKPRSVAGIADLWRGEPYPKHIHLLDNDFFGQPKPIWKAKLAEIRDGGFKVCFNQGINIRVITDEIAAELATVRFTDDSFSARRLYTAWDSIGDEALFFSGVDRLEAAGIRSSVLMVYMLIGWDPDETWAKIFHRFDRMKDRGIRPYPMPFEDKNRTIPLGECSQKIGHRTLGEFQRWVIRKAYNFVAFQDYDVNAKGSTDRRQLSMLEAA